jgi:hypothetical protein
MPQPNTTQPKTEDPLDASKVLLPYLLGLIALCIGLQVAVVLAGNEIGVIAWVLVILVAIYYGTFLLIRRSILRRVRFGPLVAHAVTYVVVCGSFQLHAAVLTIAGSSAIQGDDYFPIDPGWFGPTLAMAGVWAIGFTIHAVASVAQRGYER